MTPKSRYKGIHCATKNGQIPANTKEEFMCNPATFGRMVMIKQIKSSQHLSIVEMEVFGQDRFSYGPLCKYEFDICIDTIE